MAQRRKRRAVEVPVWPGQLPPPAERAALDRAILAVYRQAGITADPATHHRPAPLLKDLAGVLQGDTDPAAASNKAAAPVTCGAAMDVPEKSA